MRIYRRKGSAYWHVEIILRSADGKRLERRQRSTHLSDKEAARQLGARWEREAVRDPGDRAREAATLWSALEHLSNHLAVHVESGEMSAATAGFYQKKAGHLVRVWGKSLPLREITTGLVRTYWQKRLKEGVISHTIDKEIGALKLALRLSAEHGEWTGNLRALKPAGLSARYKPRKRWLTQDEVHALRGQFPGPRWAILAFCCATGAEDIAIARAERSDVDLVAKTVRVRGTKTDLRDRVIPIVLEACVALLGQVLELGDGKDGFLFRDWPNMRNDFNRAARRLWMEHFSTNDLRRSFAHWHKQAGISNDVLKDAMGHSSTKMLDEVYGRAQGAELAELMKLQMKKH